MILPRNDSKERAVELLRFGSERAKKAEEGYEVVCPKFAARCGIDGGHGEHMLCGFTRGWVKYISPTEISIILSKKP